MGASDGGRMAGRRGSLTLEEGTPSGSGAKVTMLQGTSLLWEPTWKHFMPGIIIVPTSTVVAHWTRTGLDGICWDRERTIL